MLTEMLNQSDTLSNYSKPDQTILMTLAHKFQSQTTHLFMSPEELYETTEMGTPAKWHELLLLQETKNFIKSQMAFLAQVAQRKTFSSLVQMALSGGQGAQQAAKQVQELSGVLNQQDTNRTIVLHRIPRPTERQGETV